MIFYEFVDFKNNLILQIKHIESTGKRQSEDAMKFLSSLKAWKKRGNIKQIRRGKQVVLIDPDKPKFKAKQGFRKK